MESGKRPLNFDEMVERFHTILTHDIDQLFNIFVDIMTKFLVFVLKLQVDKNADFNSWNRPPNKARMISCDYGC